MQAALSQVTAVMGDGNVNALPPQARDWRYYFRFWAQAYTKYLLNRSKDPTWQQLYADDLATTKTLKQINPDNLFFDLNNGLDKFEYVDRTNAATLGAPIDFEYDILLLTSNTQDGNYYQRLEREEKALYQSMLTDKTAVPGSNENVFLSDLFGSPAIANAGFCMKTPAYKTKTATAFDCCTKENPSNPGFAIADCDQAGGKALPLPHDSTGVLRDGLGRPLFTNYKGIFTDPQADPGATPPVLPKYSGTA